jgi:hypothetical protein
MEHEEYREKTVDDLKERVLELAKRRGFLWPLGYTAETKRRKRVARDFCRGGRCVPN